MSITDTLCNAHLGRTVLASRNLGEETSIYQSRGRVEPWSGEAARRSGGTPHLGLPPLAGRTFLIINATDGIGKYTASLLAKVNSTVLVHGKKDEKVQKAVEELRRESGNNKVHGFAADLSLMSVVGPFASRVVAKHGSLHGLLFCTETFSGNSMGRKLTPEGKEYSLAVNVMAPYLLISLLMGALKSSTAGRILITTSSTAETQKALVNLHEYVLYDQRWSDTMACEMSKLCAQMIGVELNNRYADPPALCFHLLDPSSAGPPPRGPALDSTVENNTEMLRSVWSHGGTSVRTIAANRSFQMLTEDHFQQSSGERIACGSGGSEAQRRKLMLELEALTGAKYPSPTSS